MKSGVYGRSGAAMAARASRSNRLTRTALAPTNNAAFGFKFTLWACASVTCWSVLCEVELCNFELIVFGYSIVDTGALKCFAYKG